MKTTCDSSLLIPAMLQQHALHREARALVLAEVTGLAAHVVVETFSVLTRLPGHLRLAPADAAAVIQALGYAVFSLPAKHHVHAVARIADAGIGGGSAFDAIVGATAAHHGWHLISRDRRAARTYDAVGVSYTLV